jgi:hypothetical protein
MGMCAEVIAIGPYSRNVSALLDYKPELYISTPERAVISRRLFGINEGSTLSRKLATLLGIHDPWNFGEHKIIPSRVNIAGLREFAAEYSEYTDEVHAFEVLLGAGFEFHFRPEG